MPELKTNSHKKESDSLALAKGKNKEKNINLANEIFASADKFFMEMGFIEDTYYHRHKENQSKK